MLPLPLWERVGVRGGGPTSKELFVSFVKFASFVTQFCYNKSVDLTDKSELINFLRSKGLWAQKKLGQNFLVCRDVLDSIIAAADISSDDTILEVGPGLGTLTRELCKKAGRVIAVEKDSRLISLLKENTKDFNNLEIIEADILKLKAISYKLKAFKVVANIPYYLTSHLIQHFLQSENPPEMMVLMVQKEVAERIVSQPPKMQFISVLVHFYAEAEIVRQVPHSCFFPEPEVDSAVVKIEMKTPTQTLPLSGGGKGGGVRGEGVKEFFRIVKAGFSAKRKTLENALSGGLQKPKAEIQDIMMKIGIDPQRRAETLSLDEWNRLSASITNNQASSSK